MRILIAGYGYVGAALAGLLVAHGHEVSALRRRPMAAAPGLCPLQADLADASSLTGIGPVDAVVFAPTPDARDEAGYVRTYVDGARNLVDAVSAGGARPRWVHVSSTSVHERDDGGLVDEGDAAEPHGFRGRRLLESEGVAAGRLPTAVLRLGGIYGPGRTGLLRRVRAGEARRRPRFTNRIHRDDAARAAAWLLERSRPAPLYLGVDRDPVREDELVGWLARRLGVPVPAREPGPVAGKRCSSARLHRDGFRFRHPSYREGYGALIGAGA